MDQVICGSGERWVPAYRVVRRMGAAPGGSIKTGEGQDLGRVVGKCMTKADVAAPAQNQLLAAQGDLGLALDGHPGSVGAVVNQHELVAPPLDMSVHARGLAVGDDDVVGDVASEGQARSRLVELDFARAVR